MATYNGRRFLDAQLQSLLDQTRTPDELIVCDDQSSDDTLEMVTAFATRAPFSVTAFRNETRKGYRENFMAAASLAKGELIAFCDQDDVWRSDKLEKVERLFDQTPALLVHHNARLVDTEGRFLRLFHPKDRFPNAAPPLSIDPWFFPYGLCQTVRRELLDFSHLRTLAPDFYFEGEVFAHDQWFSSSLVRWARWATSTTNSSTTGSTAATPMA